MAVAVVVVAVGAINVAAAVVVAAVDLLVVGFVASDKRDRRNRLAAKRSK